MSEALATIEKIIAIEKHSGADRLDICQVLGYRCIVPKDKFKVGDQVIFIQPDAVLKDSTLPQVYKDMVPRRVRAIKLRQEWSFGLVLALDEVTLPHSLFPTEIMGCTGFDVTDQLGISKYEKEIKDTLNVRRATLPYNLPKTDEIRWQNFRDPLPFGECVDVTLKIDGQSLTVYCKLMTDGYDFGVTSRQQDLKLDAQNKFTAMVTKYELESRLSDYCKRHNVSLALRGEKYGQGIAAHSYNPHSKLESGVMFYSVFNLDTLEYENLGSEHYYQKVCQELGLPTVPLLQQNTPLTRELITRYDEELRDLAGQPFEGVVVKHQNGSFKIINKYYDSKD